jgi:catechol 2,3-dioxygenase-like lactoylglutathione lyase family enzyme
MLQTIALITLVVRDYDEAIGYYTRVLGFDLVEDTKLTPEKRWVLVAPPGSRTPCLLLARAATPDQAGRIGNQTGGRVCLFLHTDNFWRDHQAMKSRGVRFTQEPRDEPYGIVAVFEDLYGNRWDLLEPRLRHA